MSKPNKLLKQNYIFIIFASIIILMNLLLYRSSLNYYFFQDDFYEIKIAKANNFYEFISFFKFLENRSSYRPIGLQTYYFVSSSFFGFNPIGFRIITFGLLISSFVLIYKLFKKIAHNKQVGFVTASFWILSSVHFMSITWIAAAWNIIGTFFFILTSILFVNFCENKNIKFYILTLFTFLLTLCSFEFFVSWPVIFAFYYFLIKRNSLRQTLMIFLPFIVFSLTYMFLRKSYASLPQIFEYNIALNIESLKLLFWYFLWSLNVPEEFKKQVITNILIFNKTFFREFWPLVVKSFVGVLMITIIGIILPLTLALIRKTKINYRIISFAIIWFVSAISPVLILPNHYFSMYATLASIGIYFLIAYLTNNYWRTIIILFLLIIWLGMSYTTISFYKDNSWMIESQRFSKEFANRITERFPTLPPNAIVVYPLNDKRHIQALLYDYAIKEIYNEPSLTIYYNNEEFLNDLHVDRLKGRKVFVY
ncbi:hypothetical protein A3A48_00665 [Candidatus Curtissbacteria bacterium RIFCSPLOWO2_01_FULL_37_9]|uniref:Glycosyltransferase RgtA/B/C/D-like domain-containing protein n=1 Tax=Candidatus Curtissbacteria bacterium RIFCSPLOWO2_01_FULL_37_9 TaxID=1797724 RepID=A0A1F5GVF4_9BACT|nr:MAG: hypothetical protein A3A48_00665 [Candidatus Curtissbacteria bacterium RIFCSPLOWO2_01_FULL_37_9]